MKNDEIIEMFRTGNLNQQGLFRQLFSASALLNVFEDKFKTSSGKGIDRINGFQFQSRAEDELESASHRACVGAYRFSPYLEVLKLKGRDKFPRIIGIPTIRDRVLLNQLNAFLSAIFPQQVPKNVASTYVRRVAEETRSLDLEDSWVCSTDIEKFYDSIDRGRLLQQLTRYINHPAAIRLTERALLTPTLPKNTRRTARKSFSQITGVPQGLSISNILASIYMMDVDKAMKKFDQVRYLRYVDDVLMYGSHDKVLEAFKSLSRRLAIRRLKLHKLGSKKTQFASLDTEFGYLGYIFSGRSITVRDSTIERFLHSIAARFSDFSHNKSRRLERFNYLNEERLCEIFLEELNERITGAISQNKRYGWIAYFSQINDLSLLHRLDHTISQFFNRLPEFSKSAPSTLKKLGRAYWEMKFNPTGGYIRNYDEISTRAQRIEFLVRRGRIAPDERLTDEEINRRYERYLHHVLSAMLEDEGAAY